MCPASQSRVRRQRIHAISGLVRHAEHQRDPDSGRDGEGGTKHATLGEENDGSYQGNDVLQVGHATIKAR